MDTTVRNIRQLSRGVEADVVVGIETVPSASITMKVTLSPVDQEWQAIQALLRELFTRRAMEHIRGALDYDDLRRARQDAQTRVENSNDAKPTNDVRKAS